MKNIFKAFHYFPILSDVHKRDLGKEVGRNWRPHFKEVEKVEWMADLGGKQRQGINAELSPNTPLGFRSVRERAEVP